MHLVLERSTKAIFLVVLPNEITNWQLGNIIQASVSKGESGGAVSGGAVSGGAA